MRTEEKETEEKVEQGEIAQMLRPYGVGIDTHSKFIAVCVLVPKKEKLFRYEKDFTTAWHGLVAAAEWVRGHLPGVPKSELDYCIESTGCYHLPVLQAFEGRPSVVNPMLAGATHRKTDVLDARMLANQSMNATWPRSFTPGEQGQKLRVLWAQKREAQRFATRCFNRINNIVLRFGHTFGATHPCRSQEGLAILDSLVAGNIIKEASFKPQALPAEIRQVIAKLMSEGENAIVQTKEAITVAKQFIKATQWETERGLVEGGDLMEFFMSVPGVGEGTAITWLAEVIDPRRFGNSKQLAAYCGCDPSLKVSAGKVTQHVRRKGNLRLHDALSQCATSVVSRGSSELAKWGADIAAKHPKGGFRKAAGAVARRIAVALWHVHRKGEPFSMDGYNFHRGTVNREPLKPEQVSVLTIDTFLGFLDITSRIPQAESAAMSPSVIIARFGFGMVIPLNRPVPGISPFCVSVFIGSLPIGRFSGPDPQPLANPLGANMHKSASARNTRSRRSPQPII